MLLPEREPEMPFTRFLSLSLSLNPRCADLFSLHFTAPWKGPSSARENDFDSIRFGIIVVVYFIEWKEFVASSWMGQETIDRSGENSFSLQQKTRNVRKKRKKKRKIMRCKKVRYLWNDRFTFYLNKKKNSVVIYPCSFLTRRKIYIYIFFRYFARIRQTSKKRSRGTTPIAVQSSF